MDKEEYQKNYSIIKDKLPQICEFFIKYYGENYREHITSRLNNTTFIFLDEKKSGKEDYALKLIEQSSIIDLDVIYNDLVLSNDNLTKFEGFAFLSARIDNLEQVAAACVLPPIEKLSDQILFHELNHIIHSGVKFLNKNNESRLMVRYGLLRQYYDIDLENKTANFKVSDKEAEDMKFYDGFNEVVTEWTSLKVLKLAEEAGFKCGGAKNADAIYSVAFPVVGDFIEGLINTIKTTFLEGNKKELLNYITSDEFDKLCKAINALIDYEYQYADDMLKKLRYRKISYEQLADMPIEKIPFDLRGYANLFKDIKVLLDELECESSAE